LSSFLIDSPVEISQSENELLERESNTSQVQKDFEFDFGTGDENVFGSGYSENLPQAEQKQRSALKPTIDAKFVSYEYSERSEPLNTIEVSHQYDRREPLRV